MWNNLPNTLISEKSKYAATSVKEKKEAYACSGSVSQEGK